MFFKIQNLKTLPPQDLLSSKTLLDMLIADSLIALNS